MQKILFSPRSKIGKNIDHFVKMIVIKSSALGGYPHPLRGDGRAHPASDESKSGDDSASNEIFHVQIDLLAFELPAEHVRGRTNKLK